MEAVILFSVISIVGIIALTCIRVYDSRHKKRHQHMATK